MLELIVTLVIIGIMLGLGTPIVSRSIKHSRVNGTASVIAGDFEQAFSLANRSRQPVRIVVNLTTKSYQVTNRAGAVIRQRFFGDAPAELHVSTMTSTVTTLNIFPNGLSSGSISVTVGIQGYTRTVTMTRAGQVRIS